MSFHRGEAFLMTLKFISTPDPTLSLAALNRVVCQAWSHNVRAGLTGEIAMRDGQFHQILEGIAEEIVPLASRILSDARHHHIAIDRFGSIPARCYDAWSCIGFDTLLPKQMPRSANGPVVRLLPGLAPLPEIHAPADIHAAARGRTY